MKKLLAELLNTPWLVEEGWLESTINLLNTVNVESIQAIRSQNVPNTEHAQIRGRTAHLPIHGPIFPRPNIMTEWFGMGTTLSGFATDFQALMENDDVDSIVLDIDSPGGSVTGVNETANMIKAARDKKNITAYVSGTGASAAYWLASAASEIVLDPTSRVGSIGVVVAYPKGDTDSIEIVNTASPDKRPDASTEHGRAVITSQLDDLANVFINTVASNRNVMTSTVLNDFGKGGILVGQKAISVGMADRIGSFEELLANNSIGDNYMTLTVDKLKADHKDVYDQVVSSLDQTAALSAKDAEIASLKNQLNVVVSTNASLEDRVKAIEKAEVIRMEVQNQEMASMIQDKLLSASNIPARLHSKVSVDYNRHIVDGKLDKVAFTTSVEQEVLYWETELSAITPVVGIGATTQPRTVAGDPDAGADTDSIKRMLGHIGVKED